MYYRTYTTRDATIAVACVSPGMQRAFAAAIGIEDAGLGRGLSDREAADRHYEPLRRQAETILASRTTAEWKAIFDAKGIPAAGVKFAVEILDDPQALANGFVHDLAHPRWGPYECWRRRYGWTATVLLRPRPPLPSAARAGRSWPGSGLPRTRSRGC